MRAQDVVFTPNEVAALLDLPERQVRKEVEHGLFGVSPSQLGLLALAYFQVLQLLGFQLGVDDRRKLLAKIGAAMTSTGRPEEVDLSSVLRLRLGEVIREVEGRVQEFVRWKEKLVSDPGILGGEPVFPRSRLAVRRVGELVERGEAIATILEDYPYLTEGDIKFAHLFVRAYPRRGRPRDASQAPPR